MKDKDILKYILKMAFHEEGTVPYMYSGFDSPDGNQRPLCISRYCYLVGRVRQIRAGHLGNSGLFHRTLCPSLYLLLLAKYYIYIFFTQGYLYGTNVPSYTTTSWNHMVQQSI